MNFVSDIGAIYKNTHQNLRHSYDTKSNGRWVSPEAAGLSAFLVFSFALRFLQDLTHIHWSRSASRSDDSSVDQYWVGWILLPP
jgi:hypothetical protein